MINQVKEFLIKKLQENSGAESVEDRIKKIANAKTWKELGVSFKEGIKILEQNRIPVVMDEGDAIITENERDYSSWESLIAIHITNYAIQNETLYTPESTGRIRPMAFVYNDKLYEYPFMFYRNTISVTINNEVVDFDTTGWSKAKYAALMPFDKIPKNQIHAGCPVDAVIEGDLKLSQDSWILCPECEIENVKKQNSNIHVIGYEGESVGGYARALASALGYRVEDFDYQQWKDHKSMGLYAALMEKDGISTEMHSRTESYKNEWAIGDAFSLVSICKAIKDNGLVKRKKDIPIFFQNICKDASVHSISKELENSVNTFMDKYSSSEGVFIQEHVDWLYNLFKRYVCSIPNIYELLEEEGIVISPFHKKIIDSNSVDWRTNEFLYRGLPGITISELDNLAQDDDEIAFVNRVRELKKSVGIEKRHGHVFPIRDDVLVVVSILLEAIVESRDIETEKDEFVEKLGGQLIPQMCNPERLRKREKDIITQYRGALQKEQGNPAVGERGE